MIALLQILLGLALLAVAYQGHRSGVVPAGTAGLRRYTPSRDESPVGFHFYLLLYLAMGLALVVWGVFAMLGIAEPMPLS